MKKIVLLFIAACMLGNIHANAATLELIELPNEEISISALSTRSSNWASLRTHHIIENPDGSYSFITYPHEIKDPDGYYTYIYEPQIVVFEQDGKVRSKKEISQELPMFGGFYEGADSFYLAFGQKNPDDDPELEVLRIVKYTKDWKRIGACSIYGADSREIFKAGSLSMAECNGYLTVHTCRVMYGTAAGHQSNMSFLIRTSDMQLVYDGSITYHENWVSHSFNQFVLADPNENRFYYVDHGDGYPRAIQIFSTKYDADNDFNPYDICEVDTMKIKGEAGDNYTGVTLSGFELSDESCIILGNSIDQAENSTSRIRNIFLTVTDRETMTNTKVMWFTHFSDADLDEGYQPLVAQKLVKLNGDLFAVLWTEFRDQHVDADAPEETEEYCRAHPNAELDFDISVNYTTKMVLIDGKGTPVSDVQVFSGVQLSDYQPIVNKEGKIIFPSVQQKKRYTYYYEEWKEGYRTWWSWGRPEADIDTNLLYQIDLTSTVIMPFRGDVTADGLVSVDDAQLALQAYTNRIAGNDMNLTDAQIKAADVNNDGELSVDDAQNILIYYVNNTVAGKVLTWEELLGKA